MASSTTPTRRTRAGWTASGACTSGSAARHSAATRPASGGAATTSTAANPVETAGNHGGQTEEAYLQQRYLPAGELKRSIRAERTAYGAMFWLTWKRLPGSYARLTWT